MLEVVLRNTPTAQPKFATLHAYEMDIHLPSWWRAMILVVLNIHATAPFFHF